MQARGGMVHHAAAGMGGGIRALKTKLARQSSCAQRVYGGAGVAERCRKWTSCAAEYKLGKLVQIAMLYLEDDDAVAAETYIKKASSLLAACKVRACVSQLCLAAVPGSRPALWCAAMPYECLSSLLPSVHARAVLLAAAGCCARSGLCAAVLCSAGRARICVLRHLTCCELPLLTEGQLRSKPATHTMQS